MNDNKNNKLVRHSEITDDVIVRIEKLAKTVSQSNLGLPFRVIDKDGNYVKNDDGTFVVNESDIIANMILGHELGLSPVSSLMLGKTLNSKSFYSILKGRELGIGEITAMSKIYNISTSNGNILSLDVTLISATILKSGTTMDYIRDAELLPTYRTINGKYAGHKYNIYNKDNELKDTYYVSDLTPKELADPNNIETLKLAQAAKKEGKIIIYQVGDTKVTSLRLIRKLSNGKTIDNTFHYSIQEAIDAGLLSGIHSSRIDPTTGTYEIIDTKSAWTYHENTMLRNRVTSISGRIMVSDLLAGTYSHEETMEIVNVQTVEELKDYEDLSEKIETK